MSSCPDYYLLSDGRSFLEYSEVLTRILWHGGITGLPYHCALSALEHLFRLGKKEGEAETDWESFKFWWNKVPDLSGKDAALKHVFSERQKLGDVQWLVSQEWTQVFGEALPLWMKQGKYLP